MRGERRPIDERILCWILSCRCAVIEVCVGEKMAWRVCVDLMSKISSIFNTDNESLVSFNLLLFLFRYGGEKRCEKFAIRLGREKDALSFVFF